MSIMQCLFSNLGTHLHFNLSQQDVIEGILNVDVAATQSDEFLHYASGGRLLPGSVPLAHRYGGHQVGQHVLRQVPTQFKNSYVKKEIQFTILKQMLSH